MLVIFKFSYADCNFLLSNYSSETLIAKAGFYHSESSETFTIQPAQTRGVLVKSPLSCNSSSPSGLGVTYINLIQGKSNGGWVYILSDKNIIRATGQLSDNQNKTFATSPNGTTIILNSNPNPSADKFSVVVEKAIYSVSKQKSSLN